MRIYHLPAGRQDLSPIILKFFLFVKQNLPLPLALTCLPAGPPARWRAGRDFCLILSSAKDLILVANIISGISTFFMV